jgi:3-hydroxyisobutyrate dehydrogenase-like beta-hydroxyacid dehydrogenase
MTTAFLGLGRMGAIMAPRLAASGGEVVAWNRTPRDIGGGVRMAASAEQAIAGARTVLIMADEAGTAAIIDALALPLDDRRIVIMGTLAPQTLLRLAARIGELGGRPVEAPVLGTTGPAASGALIVLVGGAAEDFAAVRPLLGPLARAVVHTGAIGTATPLKFAHNLMLTNYFAILGEAIALCDKVGIDRAALIDVLVDSPAANGVLAGKRAFLLAQGGSPAFRFGGMASEMAAICGFARRLGLTLPISEVTAARAGAAVTAGRGEADVSTLALEVAQGLVVRP